MEKRFYQTQEIAIPLIAQALVLEYQAQGYEAEHFVANCREQERTVSHERDTGTSALFLDVLPAHG
jgi:hypothetical protein